MSNLPPFVAPEPPPNVQRRIAHADPSLVGAARRAAAELGATIPFPANRAGRDALLATELASNLSKHARDGELLLRALGADGRSGLELLAIDRGPGIRNLVEAVRDGASTASSPGTGLGAIRRMADVHDIDTRGDRGTVVMARLHAKPCGAGWMTVGAICQPRADETLCGDAWSVAQRENACRLIVVDGLGHGPLAAAAAAAGIAAFHAEPAASPAEVLAAAHAAMRPTRGGAVLMVEVDRARGELRYAGVGNITAQIVSGESSRSLVSHNGTVGHEMRRVQEFAVHWPEGALLVVHSDGLGSKWDLAAYPGLASRHPSVVAGVLYRDFVRGRDDVTVLVVAARRPEWRTAS